MKAALRVIEREIRNAIPTPIATASTSSPIPSVRALL